MDRRTIMIPMLEDASRRTKNQSINQSTQEGGRAHATCSQPSYQPPPARRTSRSVRSVPVLTMLLCTGTCSHRAVENKKIRRGKSTRQTSKQRLCRGHTLFSDTTHPTPPQCSF